MVRYCTVAGDDVSPANHPRAIGDPGVERFPDTLLCQGHLGVKQLFPPYRVFGEMGSQGISSIRAVLATNNCPFLWMPRLIYLGFWEAWLQLQSRRHLFRARVLLCTYGRCPQCLEFAHLYERVNGLSEMKASY